MSELINDLSFHEDMEKKIEEFYLRHFASTELLDKFWRTTKGINRKCFRENYSLVKVKEVFGRKTTNNMLFEMKHLYDNGLRGIEKQGWFRFSEADLYVYAFVRPDEMIIHAYSLPKIRAWYDTEGKNYLQIKEYIQHNKGFDTYNILVPIELLRDFKVYDTEVVKL